MEKKLIPYSVYLPEEHINKLRKLAKERKASQIIREALVNMLDGNDKFKNGYNKAVKDAAKVVRGSPEAEMISIKKRFIGDILAVKIEALEKK